jgi:hypothetical protein
VIAVGAVEAAACVVLGAAVVDSAAVVDATAVASLLSVLNGTVVPSRRQFLVVGQLMSGKWVGSAYTTPLCVAHAVRETVLNDCACTRAAPIGSRNREPRMLRNNEEILVSFLMVGRLCTMSIAFFIFSSSSEISIYRTAKVSHHCRQDNAPLALVTWRGTMTIPSCRLRKIYSQPRPTKHTKSLGKRHLERV